MTQSKRYPEYRRGEISGQDLGILVQRLDEGGASRLHVDIHSTDVDAEVARLEQLGATPDPASDTTGGSCTTPRACPSAWSPSEPSGWPTATRAGLGVAEPAGPPGEGRRT